MIGSVLVANRGEIARRIFATCRALGIECVAVHSDADADQPFVREADRAVRLPGDAPGDTYLRGDLVVEAARVTGADAIHPGYGFLAENAAFARAVVDAGLVWIGPGPETIEQMGSKVRAKQAMRAAGVPTLDVDPATVTAADFPLLVKASAGGGGRGMRVVETAETLDAELAAAGAEAASVFGDGTVFVEPHLPHARHVEVQVLADRHGGCEILGERDCSVQRRYQKVVEESPAPGLSESTVAALRDAAAKAVKAASYVGAGTVEFLVDAERVHFLEMNTRLQVEHPVTECVEALDLVAEQIAVAEGRPLSLRRTRDVGGHAIEVRLYAEDPAADWAPSTGRVHTFEVPADTAFAVPRSYGVRVDSAVGVGSDVSVHYDPMLAKVVAWAPDRVAAIRLLGDALRRTVVGGVSTNLELLRAAVADPAFVAGELRTSLLAERLDSWTAASPTLEVRGRAATAAALADAVAAQSAARVQPRIPAAFRSLRSAPRTRTYETAGEEITVGYERRDGSLQPAEPDLVARSVSPAVVVLEAGGVAQRYEVSRHGNLVDVVTAAGHVAFRRKQRFLDPADVATAGSLVASMPGAVARVHVEVGQRVVTGDPVVVLEAMKMQHQVNAPGDGVVEAVHVRQGQQVGAGDVLAVIVPATSEGDRDG